MIVSVLYRIFYAELIGTRGAKEEFFFKTTSWLKP